jgi:hypothetical protein
MAKIQKHISELQGMMPGGPSKREAKKMAAVLARHGVRDIEEVKEIDDATFENFMAEAEGE